jgi:hypothetical protein
VAGNGHPYRDRLVGIVKGLFGSGYAGLGSGYANTYDGVFSATLSVLNTSGKLGLDEMSVGGLCWAWPGSQCSGLRSSSFLTLADYGCGFFARYRRRGVSRGGARSRTGAGTLMSFKTIAAAAPMGP